MASASSDVEIHAAAFVVALMKNGMLDEAAEFVEWYEETIGVGTERLLTLVEAEEP